MKDNELMRGDYVMFYDKHKIGHVAKVDQVLRHSCLLIYKQQDEDLEVIVNYEDISPIGLTVELLEKNDCRKWTWHNYPRENVITYAIGDGFQVEVKENIFALVDNCTDSGDYGYDSNWIAEVKYVHKLQHLIRELEIEKEIIL